MISIRDVSHSYGDQPILSDVTLEVPTGGVTALVGPNGAGKSTLLSLVARLVPLQMGRIEVAGFDVTRTPSRDLARRLAILPQTTEVAPRLTVTELIGFGRYPHHLGRPGPGDHAQVARAIETFDLGELAHRSLDSLSGGQRQRAFVAMVFAQDTEVVLLDEPLNNLDIAASRSLMRTLRALADDHGRTVVVVLHDINYAAAYADRMITLAGGQLGPCGAPGEIVTEALLREVFGTDAGVLRKGGQAIVQV
ncbi:ABC transporter ATP-binding protein [Sulfitobacter alexandrii]|uniref:ABC transporter ATP-binding protein n=1 Tax=Sulfitobacter alexandrii TaxID=1917485 RepID=A0A1J0WDX7_9RHOB|nr:ATP-binding cassette domain-containing protein [Sulfitobacter alexandrii]APE42366.1 ABC transporter ATP-binding protein [Sulfitobacter alexandrii]